MSNTLRYLIGSLDARRTSVREQAQMWLDELEAEPDLRPHDAVRITARIERLSAEAQLRSRQINALEVWTSVDMDHRDLEAVQLLKEQYEEQMERAIVRAGKLQRSPWEHDNKRGEECMDRAATLTKYINTLNECLR